MKKIILLFIALGICVPLTSCSFLRRDLVVSGDVVTKTINVDDFDGINIKNIYLKSDDIGYLAEINLIYGEEEKVEITTNEGLFDDLKVEVKKKTLQINAKKNICYVLDNFNIDIYGKNVKDIDISTAAIHVAGLALGDELDIELSGSSQAYINGKDMSSLEVSLSGASDIEIYNTVSINNVKINASGASDFEGDIIVSNDLEIDLSGASGVLLKGSAENLDLDSSGSSFFRGESFNSTKAEFDLSGASYAIVNGANSLNYHLSGSSKLEYITDIADLVGTCTGASSISKK